MRILLVEDEPGIAQFISQGLAEACHVLDIAKSGREGKNYALSVDYDIIILDIMLPEIDGFKILEEIRSQQLPTPVLLLTARDRIEDRVKGLDLGADDYLVKPFAFSELLARLRALQRRAPVKTNTILQVCDLTMDVVKREVKRRNKIIDLSPLEFRLLEYLLRNPNRVLTRTEIAERIWNLDFYTDSNVVNVYIGYLRKKIDQDFDIPLLHTVRGVGYCVKAKQND